MKPFFIKVDAGMALVVVPDSEAHLDGHPVLAYSYSIFKRDTIGGTADDGDTLQASKRTNPHYLGTIVFEEPEKLFNYVADGQSMLSSDEVQEAIVKITDYRNNPGSWSI